MIQRILRVSQREYVAYVKTRTFLFSALALPIVLMLAVGLPVMMESFSKPPRTFTIVDEGRQYDAKLLDRILGESSGSGKVLTISKRDYLHLSPEWFSLPRDPQARLETLAQSVQDGQLFAFLLLSAGDSTQSCSADYYTVDPAADELPRVLRQALNRVVALDQLLPLVGNEALLTRTLDGIPFQTHAITEEGGEEVTAAHIARSYAPMAFVYLLWLSVFMMASHLMTSTIEEKTSRVIEVLLSSVSPFEFMMGKLVGLGGAGLTMIGTWALTGVAVLTALQNPTAHQIAAGIASSFTGLTIFWFLLFFLLGFLFFSSIFVGLGSVCNTIREAHALVQPVTFAIMIPLFLMAYVTSNPDHIIAVIASFFPPFTPFVIMNRIPANPPAPLWQILLAALILIVSTWLMIRAAAKIFRIGILMYGKPPTLSEIIRWARQSE